MYSAISTINDDSLLLWGGADSLLLWGGDDSLLL